MTTALEAIQGRCKRQAALGAQDVGGKSWPVHCTPDYPGRVQGIRALALVMQAVGGVPVPVQKSFGISKQ